MLNETVAPEQQISAIERVFHIPELLENILHYLITREILLCQRVCHNFRNTVKGSIRLRRALFFDPIPADTCCLETRPRGNVLLLRAFASSFPSVVPVDKDNELGRYGNHDWSYKVCLALPADRLPSCSPAVDYPEASWRKMFLCQPPNRSLYLNRRWQRSLRPAVVRDDGIKMGDIVDEVNKPAPAGLDWLWHESYISSDRDWHFEGKVL